jgi:hypothetical protein
MLSLAWPESEIVEDCITSQGIRATAEDEADANKARAALLREGSQEFIAASRIIDELPALVEAAARLGVRTPTPGSAAGETCRRPARCDRTDREIRPAGASPTASDGRARDRGRRPRPP